MPHFFPECPIPMHLASSLVFGLLVAIWLRSWLLRRSSSGRTYPPSPPGDPLIGHARKIPGTHPWMTFSKWAKLYGDVIYLHVLGRPIVLVSSMKAARDLLDKNGANYSDRPNMTLLTDMMGWGPIIPFESYGEHYRKLRRMMQQHFNPQAIRGYQSMHLQQVDKLMSRLLENPVDFYEHFQNMNASVMTLTTYGYEPDTQNDKFITLIEHAIKLTNEVGSMGAALADLFPILQHVPVWFPGAGFKRKALSSHKVVRETLDSPYLHVKEHMVKGTAIPSVTSILLADYERKNVVDPQHEEDVKGLGGAIYAAGVETTFISSLTWILNLIQQPEILQKAQEEIERVVGKDQLPEFEDRSSLPYLECILKESLRWNTPLPLGLPHCSVRDDTYNGMFIPGGSLVMPNLWHMMRDEEIYPEPDKFNPDRFMQSPQNEDWCDPRQVVFGFGRRICPGRFFAEAVSWLTMVRVIAAFDILPGLDADGKPQIPEIVIRPGVSSLPAPFKCRFVPRNKKFEVLIRQMSVH